MIYFAESLEQLRSAVYSFIEICGEKGRIGSPINDERLDSLLQLELVFVDRDGNIVGDEANDYQPKPGEVKCVKISQGDTALIHEHSADKLTIEFGVNDVYKIRRILGSLSQHDLRANLLAWYGISGSEADSITNILYPLFLVFSDAEEMRRVKDFN